MGFITPDQIDGAATPIPDGIDMSPPVFDEAGRTVISGQAPAPAAIPSTGGRFITPDLFDAPSTTPGRVATGGLLNIGGGLTLGLMDEIAAGGSAFVDALGGAPLGASYDQRLADARAMQQEFRDQAGGAKYFVDIASGGLMPVGKALAAAATTGAKLREAVKLGGALGAGYGFGSSEGTKDRLSNALMGGAVGAIAAPVIGGVVESGGKALANTGIFNRLKGQRGAIFSGDDVSGYSPAEVLLAKQLENAPIEKVAMGADEMARALSDDIPLFLPEALNSAKVNRNARFIANYEPSMEFSQEAIAARTKDAPVRAEKLLEALSPESSAFYGANKMSGAADDIIKMAEGAREEAAFPLYQDAYADMPRIISGDLDTLLGKDKVLNQAIAAVKKTANNADLPENSTKLLVKARQEISNKIESAINKGFGREARDLTDTYGRLNSILHKESPLLKAADETYATMSSGIDGLNSTFLESLRKMTGDKIKNIGQVFNLPAERIEQLRGIFKSAGKLDEWNAGIRAHLQNTVQGTKEGRNFTDKIIGNTIQEAKLKAAVGDSYDKLQRGLKYEGRMFEGKNKYHEGSSTAGNLAERSAFEDQIGILASLKQGDIKGALSQVFKQDLPEKTAQDLAKIYFSPATGAEKIQKIIPLLKQYKIIDSAAVGASRGSMAAIPSLGQKTKLPQTTPQNKTPISSQGRQPLSEQLKGQGLGGSNQKASAKSESKAIASQVKSQIASDPVDAAIFQVESSEGKNLKNPTSSAKGAFQLIDSTAKSLGVKDPMNLAENYAGYKKLKAEHVERFGDDPEVIYAAHFLGATTLNKLLNDEPLTTRQKEHVEELEKKALPAFRKAYRAKLAKQAEEMRIAKILAEAGVA